jgi:hypothetical protein
MSSILPCEDRHIPRGAGGLQLSVASVRSAVTLTVVVRFPKVADAQ